MRSKWTRGLALVMGFGVDWGAAPGLAHAHHGMDDAAPQSLTEGLLAGVAHPVIDPEHLVFLLALGLLVARRSSRKADLVAFVAASLAGCVWQAHGLGLPTSGGLLAATLLLLGAVCAADGLPAWSLIVLLIGCGLVHGAAYGDAMAGASDVALGAHVLGLAVCQVAVFVVAAWVARRARAFPWGATRLHVAAHATWVIGCLWLAASYL